jgi:hypothetical protein
MYTNLWKENPQDEHDLDDEVVERRIIDWIDLAQDKDQWRSLVNTVMNLIILQSS